MDKNELNYSCDGCGEKQLRAPFFHLLHPRGSIDFCADCFQRPITVKEVRYPRVHVRGKHCFFCAAEIYRGRHVVLRRSKSRLYVCHLCDETIQVCVQRSAQPITEHTAVIERDEGEHVFVDLTPCPQADSNSPGFQTWAALIEDLIYIPRTFGSAQQWTVFQEGYFQPRPGIRVYLLENIMDGRIACCVSDATCRCIVFFLYPSRAMLTSAQRGWKKTFQHTTALTFRHQQEYLTSLLDRKRFHEAVNLFLGHLCPGTSQLIALLIRVNHGEGSTGSRDVL